MRMIYVLLLFIGSQAFLLKGNVPEKYKQIKLRYLLVGSVVLMGLSAVLDYWPKLGGNLVLTVTVLCSSVIIYKFQRKYEEMERGKL